MTPSLKENLITTKDAGELFGYTSDYLARLARSGKISGRRVGHTWLVDRESLVRFVDQQGERKVDYARALARAREAEYRAHRSLTHRTIQTLSRPIVIPEFDSTKNSLRSQALALSVACAVLVAGAVGARAAVVPQLATSAAALAQDAAFGFHEAFGDIPLHIASEVDAMGATMRSNDSYAVLGSIRTMRIASPLENVDLAVLQPASMTEYHAPAIASAAYPIASTITIGDIRSSASDLYTFLTTPSRVGNALTAGYVAVGNGGYAAITASLAAYDSLIKRSGTGALALAASGRDASSRAPQAIGQMGIALGDAIIDASHAAIRADVALAYGTAAAAPESARVMVALIGGTGDLLARATSRVPSLATAAYLTTTALPAALAPKIASAVFNAEYAMAVPFVRATNDLGERYLALIEGTGNLAYAGTENTLALARTAKTIVAHAPAALEDAYLGVLGNGALALDTLTRVPSAASALAAVAPTLSAGEQAALTTYETIRGLFDATTDALATLFVPTPTIVTPSAPVRNVAVTTATSTRSTAPATIRQTVNTYPTYTTVVQGVSQDVLNQSLAALRSDILSTAAGMIQPVAAQTATNATTIQYVNMIQNLSNLTVNNGTFKGGTFDSGSITNASSISAGSGSFSSLTVGGVAITGSAATTTSVLSGGTGLTVAPAYGELLVGNGSGGYALTATSSLGIISGVWGAITGTLSAQTDLQSALDAKFSLASWYATTTDALAQGSLNRYWSDTLFDNRLSATTSLPNLATLAGLSSLGSYTGLIAGNNGSLYQVASSSLFGFTPANNATTISTTYPLLGGGDLSANRTFSLAFGTTTANSWSALQQFNGGASTTALTVSGTASTTGLVISGVSNGTTQCLQVDATGVVSAIGAPCGTGSGSVNSVSNSDSTLTISPTTGVVVASLNLGHANSWSALQQFTNATSTLFSSTYASSTNAYFGTAYIPGLSTLAGAFLAVDGNGQIIATTTPVTSVTADYPLISLGTSASHLSLAFGTSTSNTWGGTQAFTNIAISGVPTCTGGQALQTDGSGNVSCGSINIGGASIGGGWTTNNVGSITLATTTDRVGIGATTTPYAKLSVLSGSTATTTLALVAANGQTANILDIYGASGNLSSVVNASGYFGIGTTSPFAQLSVAGNGYFDGSLTMSNLTATGTATIGSLSGLIAGNNGSLYQVASSSLFGFTPVSNQLAKGNFLVGDDTGVAQATSSIFVSSTGQIGIGTTSPIAKLDIWGNLNVATGSTSALFVNTATGNVGIGTANPVAKLSVSGSAIVGGTTIPSGSPQFTVNMDASQVGFAVRRTSASAFSYFEMFNESNASVFRLNQSSQLLIGSGMDTGLARSSAGNLSVINGGGAAYWTIGAGGIMAGADNTYDIGANGSGRARDLWVGRNALIAGNLGIGTTSPYSVLSISNSATTAANTPLFTVASTTGGTSTSTLMTVLANGNVGIGTTSPTNKLDVVGNIKTYGDSIGISLNDIAQNYSTSFQYRSSLLGLSNIANLRFGGVTGTNAFTISDYDAAIRFIVNRSGSVGIGTTSPASLLDVAGQAIFGTDPATTAGVVVRGGASGTAMFTLHRTSGVNSQFSWALAGGGLSFTDDTNGFLTTNIYGDLSTNQLYIGQRSKTTSDSARSSLLAGQSYGAAAGADVSAGNLTILGGLGTGAGTPGDLVFQTGTALGSGTTVQSGTTRLMIKNSTGNIGIGTTSPYSLLALSNSAATAANTPLFTIASTTNGTATSTLFSVQAGGNTVIGVVPTSSTYYRKLTVNNDNGQAVVAAFTQSSGASMFVDFGTSAVGANNGFRFINTGAGEYSFVNGYDGANNVLKIGRGGGFISEAASDFAIAGATGLVGIGTTSPYAQLSISNSATTAANTPLFTIASTTGGVSTSTLMTVLANGQVGIGSNVPDAPLYVSGLSAASGVIAHFYGGSGYGGYARITVDSINADSSVGLMRGGSTKWSVGNDYPTDAFRISQGVTGTNDFLTITTAGYTGIGTTSPFAQLSVAGNGYFDGSLTMSNLTATGTATIGSLSGLIAGNSGTLYAVASSSLFGFTPQTNQLAQGNFLVGDDTGVAQATSSIFVSSTGNIGIGTTSPVTALDVNGNIRADGIVQALQKGGSNYMFSMDAANGSGPRLQLGNLTSPALFFEIGSWNNINNFDTKNRDLQFYASGGSALATQGITLKQATGYVGIGTTSPYSVLSISNSATTAANTPLFTIASTTGGTSTSTLMTVLANGNVGIGTNAPTAPLHVVGNSAGLAAAIQGGSGFGSLKLGADVNASTLTASTRKLARITMPAWDAGATNVLIFSGDVTGANANDIYFGGTPGSAQYAATGIHFVTGATGTTAGGTERMTVNNNGLVGIGTISPSARLDITTSATSSAAIILRDISGNDSLEIRAGTSTLANTLIGVGAGAAVTSGVANVALGYQALLANTTGSFNIANGYQALDTNTTGSSNVANGYQALTANTTGSSNVANGYSALAANTTGSNNVADGNQALSANKTGNNNVAIGTLSLLYNASATSTTALGYWAGRGTAAYNNQGGVYVGYGSGYSAATGSDYNTLVGYQAGYGITTGSNNIWIGSATSSTAIANLTTGSQNILIGNNISLPSATASGQLNIGNIIFGTNITGTDSTLSTGNIGIGTTSPFAKFSVAGNGYFDGSLTIGTLSGLVAGNSGTLYAVASSSLFGFTPQTNQLAKGNFLVGDDTGVAQATSSIFVSSTGNIGIGTTSPAELVHVSGTTADDIIRSDIGYDINPVASPAAPSTALIASPGNVDAGTHYYRVTYYTALGETGASNTSTIVTDALDGQVTVTLPVSSDYRVTGRRIYRSKAIGGQTYLNFLLVDIPDNTTTTYIDNIADSGLGTKNGYFVDNSTSRYITVNGNPGMLIGTGLEPNTTFGNGAGANLFNGTAQAGSNAFFGYNAGHNITTGSKNVAVGFTSLNQASSGGDNEAMGWSALNAVTTGAGNIGIGTQADYRNQTGSYNISIGHQAGLGVLSNSHARNISIGSLANFGITTGNNNMSMGYQTGYALTSGANNMFLGQYTASTTATGSNNIAIGYDIALPSANGSNQLNIGNLIFGTNINGEGAKLSTGNIGIGTISPSARLDITTSATSSAAIILRDLLGNDSLELRAGTSTLQNTLIGVSAGAAVTTGSSNVALGYQALTANRTGTQNTALGYQALFSNTTGGSNSATGFGALYSNTTGSFNTANGFDALYLNSTGTQNTALGYNSLDANTTGSTNTALGYSSLSANTTGSNNVAVGGLSLLSNTSGARNTTLGFGSLSANTTGSANTAIGYQTGFDITTGYDNIVIGNGANTGGNNITTGHNNILLGYSPVGTSTASSNFLNIGNSFFGIMNATTSSNTLPTDYSAVKFGIGSSSPWAMLSVNPTAGMTGPAFAIGSLTGTSLVVTNGGLVGIGTSSPTSMLHIAKDQNTGTEIKVSNANNGFAASTALTLSNDTGNIGSIVAASSGFVLPQFQSRLSLLASTGVNIIANSVSGDIRMYTGGATLSASQERLRIDSAGNIGIGTTSPSARLDITTSATSSAAIILRDLLGNDSLELRAGTSTLQNTLIGISAGAAVTTGSYNVALGRQALLSNTTGSSNVANGSDVLHTNTTGSSNSAMGNAALYSNTTGSSNSAIGDAALYYNSTGSFNAALGGSALFYNTTGSSNSAIGSGALYYNSTGSSNIALGDTALFVNDTGSFNTAIGSQAGSNITAGYDNIVIGNGVNTGGNNITTGHNNILLGYSPVGTSTASTNFLNIGNSFFGIMNATTSSNTLPTNYSAVRFGIGTSSPATMLEVGGSTANVTFDGYLNCTGFTSNANGTLACTASDQRLKQEVTALATSSVLAGIDALDPVSFYWRPETGRGTKQQYGLIAQQVQEVFPNLVVTSSPTDLTPDGTLSVNYEGLISPMILAIQELDKRTSWIDETASTTGMQSSVLTADGTHVDLYKLATYTLATTTALADKVGAQEVRLTSLETRVAALEGGAISTASNSPIAFSSSTLASALSGFDILVQKGIAQFNTLVFRQLVASKDADGTSSAGSVTIIAGNTVAQVNNSLVLPSTKVFITFNSQITGSWWVSDKTIGSFRVVLSESQASDVSFDYFLVQTEGQLATSTSSVASGVTQSSGPDTVAPTITVLGDNPLHLSVDSTFAEPGVTVADAVDGTDPVVTFINGVQQEVSSATITTATPTTYLITYKATDAAGNSSTATRSVIVGNPDGTVSTGGGSQASQDSTDTVPPIVTLNGSAAIQLYVGDTFTDPGATATDDADGDLTAKITEAGSVDTAVPGDYSITYSVTDAAGNTGSVSRLVTVAAAPAAPAAAPTTESATTGE